LIDPKRKQIVLVLLVLVLFFINLGYVHVRAASSTDNLTGINKKLDSLNKTITAVIQSKNPPIIDPIYLVAIIGLVMVIPAVIDMVMAYIRKTTGQGKSSEPVGMHGLYRTLMTFGVVLLVGSIIFYILELLNRNSSGSSELIDTLKNLSTILGTALATIIAFYFGIRGTTGALEKAAQVISGGVAAPDATAPTINRVSPDDMSKEVAVNSHITARFSEPMSSSSITHDTFTIRGKDNKPIPGTVTLTPDGLTATFIPDRPMDNGTEYHATITTGATDQTGNPMLSDKKWSFTTVASTPPPTPPTPN
jgi:hypothetical protein